MAISRRQFVKMLAAVLPAAYLDEALGQNAAIAPSTAPDANAIEFSAPGVIKVPYFGHFQELPVGAVRPLGWIKSWLQRQAEGLTGHPENLAYPYDTCMYAGKVPLPAVAHGEIWWPYEQSGYFIDGAVRLDHQIDAPAIRALTETNINYILNHSGPAKLGESTWGWPNTVVGRALIAQYGATGDTSVAQALAECLLGTHSFGGRDGDLFEEALYLYAHSGEQRFLDIANRVHDRFYISDPKSFSQIDKIHGASPLREHGVTAAEQLKLLPLLYVYTGDAKTLELANQAYSKVESDSLMPDGGIVSSENLGTTAFNSLHETCDITDWSWSIGYLLMAGGNARWSDLIERTTFNALPGAVTKDFKQLQYFSSANQVLASSTACPRIAATRMSYRAGHETPCCSGNVNRAMPNYVTRMWMRGNDGLAAVLYGPSEVTAEINGNAVTISEETDYPFRDTISFKITTEKPIAFPLQLRIPEWCPGAGVTINGSAENVEAKPGTFLTLNREFHNGDTVMLKLPMNVEMKEWFNGNAVSVQRGPLVYSLKVDEKRVEISEDTPLVKRVLKGHDIEGFPAVEFYPQSEWRYGIEAAEKDALPDFNVIESPMTENPFELESVPVRIEVSLRSLPQWAATWKPTIDPPPSDLKSFPQNPTSLPTDAELLSAGEKQKMTLVPYGSTHLRLTTLPVIRTKGA